MYQTQATEHSVIQYLLVLMEDGKPPQVPLMLQVSCTGYAYVTYTKQVMSSFQLKNTHYVIDNLPSAKQLSPLNCNVPF